MSVRARVLMTVVIAACTYDRPTLVDDDAGAIDSALGPDATAADAGTPCATDPECPSQVCSPDGCVAPSAVRYVGPIGSDSGPCTQSEPCSTIARALAVHGTPAYVSIAFGSYPASVVINPLNQAEPAFDVWLIGSGPLRPVVLATDDGSNRDGLEVYRGAVHLRHLEVRGSLSNTASDAIWTDVGTTVTLDDVVVSSARNDGFECNDCTLVADRSIFRGNARLGLRAVSGSVTVRGSQFRNNAGGGAELSGDDCTVTSSLFVDNGNDTAAFGGASLSCTTHRFDGNTLAGNRATTTAAVGVRCLSAATTVNRNNLFAHPGTAAGSCSYTYSLFASGMAPPGTGNRIGPPDFTSTGDYHITPTSPAYGNGTSAGISVFETDLDGEPRIQGRIDIGADEIP